MVVFVYNQFKGKIVLSLGIKSQPLKPVSEAHQNHEKEHYS